MLQIDLFGGLWLQFPTDTLMNLCLFLPILLTCPLPAWVGDNGVDHIVVLGRGISFLIVQCTRFVKTVNNRLLWWTGQWGRKPLPSGSSPCISPAVFVIHSWWWLFVFVFVCFLNRSSHQGKGQGGSNRKKGLEQGGESWDRGRTCSGQADWHLTPGERASCGFGTLGKP